MRVVLAAFALGLALGAHAAEEIEEAVPLAPEGVASPPPATAPAAGSALRYRGYALIEYAWTRSDRTGASTGSFPDAEVGAAWTYQGSGGLQAFLDVTVAYRDTPVTRTSLLNQGGLRLSEGRWQFALGKERSRKSPGLIVSPSDFLYPIENLPGQREQRAGIWQGRASWVGETNQVDVLILPDLVVDEHGLPSKDETRSGGAARWFYLSRDFDVGLTLARIEADNYAGGFVQTFVGATKVYAEYGFREQETLLGVNRSDVSTALLGASHEGVPDLTLKLEYYYNGAGLRGLMPPTTMPGNIFYRRHYVIAHASAINLWRTSTLSGVLIRALGEDDRTALVRYDLPLSARQTAGFGYGAARLAIIGERTRNLWVDWKFSW